MVVGAGHNGLVRENLEPLLLPLGPSRQPAATSPRLALGRVGIQPACSQSCNPLQ